MFIGIAQGASFFKLATGEYVAIGRKRGVRFVMRGVSLVRCFYRTKEWMRM